MSHFTRIKTQLAEKQFIVQALGDMGYPVIETETGRKVSQQGVTVRGYGRGTALAEFKIATPNPAYDIGFVRVVNGQSAEYEIVADWYGIHSHINQQQFIQQISQRYAYNLTIAKLVEKGFYLQQEASETDGSMVLTMSRYA